MNLGLTYFVNTLRSFYYKRLFPNFYCGKNTIIEGKIEIQRTGYIQIGANTIICRWVCFRPWGGSIIIGDGCSINSFCHLSGNGGLIIGNNVRIGSNCSFVSANHNFSDVTIPIKDQGESAEKTIIEEDCWIGTGSSILCGVKIGRGSIIGAGSVITKDIEPYSVVVGVPGKIIKNRLDNINILLDS